MEFSGKTVIVTGAGKGIGESIALEFGKAGANVVVASLHSDECNAVAGKISKTGGIALPVKCDVSSQRDVRAMADKAMKKFGSIDVLVNNAGIYPFTPFSAMTEKQWDSVLDVNLKGVFLCCQAAAAQMVKQGNGGKIVNISSIASIMGYEGLTHYCASKGGINAFTRALSLELAKNKINVNAILPGPIRTPGIGNVDEKLLKGIVATVPLARMGEPEEIAYATVFLASKKADYITGQTLVIDGGSAAK